MRKSRETSHATAEKPGEPTLLGRIADWFRRPRQGDQGRDRKRRRVVGRPIDSKGDSMPDLADHAAHPGNNVLRRWASQ